MKVRYSIDNFAWYAGVFGARRRVQFGILNPHQLAKGVRQYMALGGAAMLRPQGKQMLEDTFGASHFEPEVRHGCFDARFCAEEESLEEIFTIFGKHIPDFELNPTLDVLEELSGKEFPGMDGPILCEDDLGQVMISFRFSVRQTPPEVGKDTSGRAKADMPTYRLFRVCTLTMPKDVLKRFVGSPMVRVLSRKELETTHGGAIAGVTRDGIPIQNNLFLS